jgi:hypothetical protein
MILAVMMCLAGFGCTSAKKLVAIKDGSLSAGLSLADESSLPQLDTLLGVIQRDTLKVKDLDGNEVLIMRAIKDEDGEMVAHDVIDAARITARFRNVAEREGKVDLKFQITVPSELHDSKWQLRFYPDMFILKDSLRLDPVIITGAEYRRVQLKGYQQYQKFIDSIISDSTRFINYSLLEIFLQRNIPEIYKFKNDSTEVSDEEFASAFGVTQQEAIDHYTWKLAKQRNNKKISRKDQMYSKFIKAPIITEGIRLDTVIQTIDGCFIYEYTQTIKTQPRLRKADIILSGEILEQEKKLYGIPRSEALTFYISSLSTFVDSRERYIKRVIERRAEANTACYIEFATGLAEVDLELGNNRDEVARIKKNFKELIANEVYDIDSIIVTSSASPEGEMKFNEKLSNRRAEEISRFFGDWMKEYSDSLSKERGYHIDMEGGISAVKVEGISFVSRAGGENWEMLDRLVAVDTCLSSIQKERYAIISDEKNVDTRENLLSKEDFYIHLRKKLYPRLRTVKFDFHLHRKGMIKDTVHTTQLDTTYMKGVEAIKERDYQNAVTLLRSYSDYNTALAYLNLGYNSSALEILERLDRTASVNYMLAVAYSRKGEDQKAVEHYLHSCRQDQSFIHRGNLDPEISALIDKYELNTNY